MSQDVKTKTGNVDFDWNLISADCPTNFRKPNPHVRSRCGSIVYSNAVYAQELLDLIEGFESDNVLKNEVLIGETHVGLVYSVNQEWASIDIGYREMIYVDVNKESYDSRVKLILGDNISVEIISDRKSNSRGFIVGSIDAGIKAMILKEILEAAEEGNAAYSGKVTGMIPNGGYFINIQGVDCFMPGSLAGINKLADFESILNTEMYVVPTGYSAERGTVIVSHRKYLQAMIPTRVDELRSEPNAIKTGNVTGSAKYGVFVEFDGCLTGMIHVNELNPEFARKHKSREIQPGDVIEFKVKEIISDTKIILTQLDASDVVDPWKEIATKYTNFPVTVEGTIKSVKDYGVFIEIEEGIVGLLHISELPEGTKPETLIKNNNITVQISRIEVETRKVFLKL